LNLTNSGALFVNQLLVTNNIQQGSVATNNSFFNFSGGTLTTSNNNGIAASILLPSNRTFTVNGTWNMVAGTNYVTATTNIVGSGIAPYVAMTLGANGKVVVTSNAVWNIGSLTTTINGSLYVTNGGTVIATNGTYIYPSTG